jgi:hypothetical protein
MPFAPIRGSAQPATPPHFGDANAKNELLYSAPLSRIRGRPLLNVRAMKDGSEAKFSAG